MTRDEILKYWKHWKECAREAAYWQSVYRNVDMFESARMMQMDAALFYKQAQNELAKWEMMK